MTVTSDTLRRPPEFDTAFQAGLEQLYRWRRDVRRFRRDPIDPALLDRLIAMASLAPSVGNAQPWRFVQVESDGCRAAIRSVFEACNREALSDYAGERAALYARLKLDGLDQAPVHLAVFADTETALGHGLGRRTMPETLAYSVVGAVHALWLAARAYGIGMGWVSIIDPEDVRTILSLPDTWQLVAYLCVGYPEEEHLDPELHRHGWQERIDSPTPILRR
ncbi:MAG: 5,6-dimethylbenzimidazole synthase [Rhodospirillales bacterium]|nr:5,6-dimethylbenzimidazole synthase [Rhodospirillales bacterium]